MDTISFGNSDRKVSLVGLGGEGILRTSGRFDEALAVIREAVDGGITYFDSARVYRDSELYYGRLWGQDPQLRKKIFQTSKSPARDRAGALKHLEESLDRLQTDYLDLWQIHDVRTRADLEQIEGRGGALEAFLMAKQQGRVRFIGVTGHHDPQILTEAVQKWPVDAVLLPVNPVEKLLGGFLTETVPAARKKGLAVIGMKLLGGGHYVFADHGLDAEVLLRFSLTEEITLPVVGCANPQEVRTLLKVAEEMKPLGEEESKKMLSLLKPHAARLAYYHKN